MKIIDVNILDKRLFNVFYICNNIKKKVKYIIKMIIKLREFELVNEED